MAKINFDNVRNNVRKSFAKSDVYDVRDELGYQAKRSSLSILIRRTGDFVGPIIESSAQLVSTIISGTVGGFLQGIVGSEIAANLGAFTGAVGGSIAGIATISLSAAIGGSFAQMDYYHQKNNIKNLYKDELAKKLHKPVDQVTIEDMETLAKTNHTIDEELSRARKQRNFAIPVAIITTLASFAAVTWALPAVLAAISAPPLAWGVGLALKLAVSFATFFAAKVPLEAIGNKMFGLKDETANDRIMEIKFDHAKGNTITPAQVLSVFAKSNPQLDQFIVKEYGKHYEDLSVDVQQQAVQNVSSMVPLERFAHEINNGTINPMELAFVTEERISSLEHKSEHPVDINSDMAVEEHRAQSFIERLGLSRINPELTHAERLNQSHDATDVHIGHL